MRADPADIQARIHLAQALRGLGDRQGAVRAGRAALKLDPDHLAAGVALAVDLTVLGRIEVAKAVYRQLAATPHGKPQALARLAVLDPTSISPEERRFMRERALDATTHPDVRIGLWFGLGFADEQAGAYDEAFAAFSEGNRLRRATLRDPDPATAAREHAASIAFVEAIFTPAFLHHNSGLGEASFAPIFIVGSPRTGSTLLEQQLADATGGFALGESSALLRAVGGRWPYRRGAPRDPGVFNVVAREYRTAARAAGWKGRGPTIDKMLDNELHVGMIALTFPSAIILRCTRSLADTGLAIFRQPFAGPGNECAFDLEDIGAELVRREGLMAYWREVLPGRVIDVAYEDLVADPGGVIGRLPISLPVGRRGGPARRPVMTASAAEVRRAPYQDAIGRWRRYEKQLELLLRILNDAELAA